MSQSVIETADRTSHVKREFKPRAIWSLVMVVALLGIFLVDLERDLEGQYVPGFTGEEQFDLDSYADLVISGTAICNSSGVSSTPGIECLPFDGHGGIAFPVVMTSIAALGAALILRWRNPIGMLLILGPMADLLGAVTSAYAVTAVHVEPGGPPGGTLAALAGSTVWVVLLVVIVPRFIMTLPNGRLRTPRWTWAVRFTYLAATTLIIISLSFPLLVFAIPNPIALPWSVEVADSVFAIAILGMMGSWVIAAFALVFRGVAGLVARRRT